MAALPSGRRPLEFVYSSKVSHMSDYDRVKDFIKNRVAIDVQDFVLNYDKKSIMNIMFILASMIEYQHLEYLKASYEKTLQHLMLNARDFCLSYNDFLYLTLACYHCNYIKYNVTWTTLRDDMVRQKTRNIAVHDYYKWACMNLYNRIYMPKAKLKNIEFDIRYYQDHSIRSIDLHIELEDLLDKNHYQIERNIERNNVILRNVSFNVIRKHFNAFDFVIYGKFINNKKLMDYILLNIKNNITHEESKILKI